MLRLIRRVLGQHLGLWLALLGAGLVVLAGIMVSDLRSSAKDRTSAQIAFFHVADDVDDLNAIVLRALARGHASAPVFAHVERLNHELEAFLERSVVERDEYEPAARQVLNQLAGYRGLAERTLVALAHGD